MADEPATTEAEGISEDDLRAMIGEELDSRISTITDGLGGIADSIVEKLKGDSGSEDSLLEKIGGMIDDKLKGISTGSGNGEPKERTPKLNIFR